MQTANVRSIASLKRGLDILRLIAAGEGISLHALHLRTGIPKASILRVVKTLLEAGQITRRTGDGAYAGLASCVPPERPRLPETPLAMAAQQALQSLQQLTPWPSDVAVRSALKMRVIDSNRASYGAKWRRSVVGEDVDLLESALGRAFLAFCAPQERRDLVERILAVDRPRARRREAIERELALTRERGFGSRDSLYSGPDSHHDQRLSAIAVPVLVGGTAAACISCVWDTQSASRTEVIERCLAHLARHAAGIAWTCATGR